MQSLLHEGLEEVHDIHLQQPQQLQQPGQSGADQDQSLLIRQQVLYKVEDREPQTGRRDYFIDTRIWRTQRFLSYKQKIFIPNILIFENGFNPRYPEGGGVIIILCRKIGILNVF